MKVPLLEPAASGRGERRVLLEPVAVEALTNR